MLSLSVRLLICLPQQFNQSSFQVWLPKITVIAKSFRTLLLVSYVFGHVLLSIFKETILSLVKEIGSQRISLISEESGWRD